MEVIDELRARAASGDSAAMTAYGKSEIAKRNPVSVRNGIVYVQRAAALKNGEACALLSVLAASGFAGRPSWSVALDLLQHAAEYGYADAQEDIRFLAREEGDDFAALRARVDIKSWLQPPLPELLHGSPRIYACRHFFSPAECQRVIALAQPKLTRADVFDPSSGAGMASEQRTNSTAALTIPEYNLPFALLIARISVVLGIAADRFEPVNILRYRPGEQFGPHYDFLEDSSPAIAANKRNYGQRVITFLIYLNADFDGGETVFPRLSLDFKGDTGDALTFRNLDDNNAPNYATLHAGAPPARGEKWLLSQWVRDRPQGGPRAAGAREMDTAWM